MRVVAPGPSVLSLYPQGRFQNQNKQVVTILQPSQAYKLKTPCETYLDGVILEGFFFYEY